MIGKCNDATRGDHVNSASHANRANDRRKQSMQRTHIITIMQMMKVIDASCANNAKHITYSAICMFHDLLISTNIIFFSPSLKMMAVDTKLVSQHKWFKQF